MDRGCLDDLRLALKATEDAFLLMLLQLECQKRESGTKPNALRRSGLIPGTLYGHQGAESVEITIPAKIAETLAHTAVVNNTIVQVNIPGLGWNGKTLLREIQSHPCRPLLYHLSFFAIGSQSSIEVDVPLHIVGEAPGVTQEKGALDTVLTDLHVQCAPDQIPDSIDVDVSQMHTGDVIHVRDLIMPDGVTVLGEPERTVVTVSATRAAASAESEASSAAQDTQPTAGAAS